MQSAVKDELTGRNRIAVVVPCHNEAVSIGGVVADFARALPGAVIYVYDNCSTDDTSDAARLAGAVVRSERAKGKGNVVRRMFADIDADIFVLVDGDNTYDASAAPGMIKLLIEDQLDMVVGARSSVDSGAYRRGHGLGNRLFNRLHGLLFESEFLDIFSGYRVLSRRFVKSFPSDSRGFEIEAELSAHALDIRAPVAEVVTVYTSREADSSSKLRTYRDGARILLVSLLLYKELRPARFFGALFFVLTALALIVGLPVVNEYRESGQVLRQPSAILAASLQIIAFIAMTAGLILDSLARSRRELKRLHYLSFAPPGPAQG